MVRKILGMTDSCKECANRAYYSGRMHVCRLVDEVIHAAHEHEVAPFCPLPDYPSKTIAGQQATIFGLREPHAGSLGLMLLTHIATKLNLALEPSACGVTIPFKDMKKDREAYLGLEYISEIAPWHYAITFRWGDRIFRLHPDADPPVLEEARDAHGELWVRHELR